MFYEKNKQKGIAVVRREWKGDTKCREVGRKWRRRKRK
jgi:hypothetical protein